MVRKGSALCNAIGCAHVHHFEQRQLQSHTPQECKHANVKCIAIQKQQFAFTIMSKLDLRLQRILTLCNVRLRTKLMRCSAVAHAASFLLRNSSMHLQHYSL